MFKDGDLMHFFNELNKPVFLKEDSDTEKYITRLKELQEQSTGVLKEKINLEIKLATLGQVGEKNIAFELMNSGMPMYILHDIHLEIEGLKAQIDYVIITRKVNFVIECKNLIGNINVDRDGNFIREYRLGNRNIKEGIYSPITQNIRHLEVLKQIRRASKSNIVLRYVFDKYFDENYKAVVVLANPKTILKDRYAKKEVRDMIIRADQLIKYIKDINDKSTNPKSSDSEMKELSYEILKLHTPNKSDYAKRYEDLLNERDKYKINESNGKIEVPDNMETRKQELSKKLKAYRLQKSREENIKAYYIFTNAQLIDLIEKLPRTKEELERVSGFGEVKSKKYGDMILKIINGK